MTDDAASRHDEPIATLLAVFEDPSTGRRRLPRLVGLLDDESKMVRIGAAWTICHVAAVTPDTVAYLTRRLVDRIDGEEPGLEAALALEYVAVQHPNAVADELDAIENEEANKPQCTPFSGSLARANYHLPEIGKRDVGRTRLAGEGSSPGAQRAYTNDEERADRRDRAGDDPVDEDDGDARSPSDDTDDHTDATGKADGGEADGRAGGESRESTVEFPSIVYESRFDQLTVLAGPRRGRYGDVYRTLGVVDGGQLPVGLVLYHRPSDRREEFETALDEQLARWAAVADHDNVVQVHDWGMTPRPWAATEYTGQRLSDQDRLGLGDALWHARELADATAHLHENGVVHGGIDPGNVVYYGNVIGEDERQPPLLDNVGLLGVVRRYFDPTSRLDPRYAAPEYFDRRFGRIDHATDVYHLGAVLYLLFTGRPPYDGEYERVRDRVLEDPAPRPGDVASLPDRIDEVVTKAMARRKLRRYETVRHMEQELRGISGDVGDDDA
jgi:hypothetical protein